MKKIILSILVITLFSIASLSFATVIGPGGAPIASAQTDELNIVNPLGGTSDIYALIIKILDFLIILAIPLTAILVIYAGLLYITSAGNAEKIKTAQKTLIWALIGFAIVLIAKGVPAIIQEFLYGKEETPAEIPEPPTESLEPDNGGTSEPNNDETNIVPVNDGPGGGGGAGAIPDESGGGGEAGVIPINDGPGGGGGAGAIPTSGTYKTCREPVSGSWAWLTGSANTLYCKEATWTGENPGDKCSVLGEACQEGAGAF